MVCSFPQFLPQQLEMFLEKRTSWAGTRAYATRLSPCSIQITISGRLFWGWKTQKP